MTIKTFPGRKIVFQINLFFTKIRLPLEAIKDETESKVETAKLFFRFFGGVFCFLASENWRPTHSLGRFLLRVLLLCFVRSLCRHGQTAVCLRYLELSLHFWIGFRFSVRLARLCSVMSAGSCAIRAFVSVLLNAFWKDHFRWCCKETEDA